MSCLGPNELFIVDAESITSILNLRKGPCECRSEIYIGYLTSILCVVWVAHGVPGTTPSITSLQDVDAHYERRKLWNQGFATATLKELQPAVENRVLELVDELSKRSSPSGGEKVPLDLALWMSNIT